VADASYHSLQREIAQRILGYTFLRGQGGPLVLIWVLGIGAFMFLWPMVELAVLWTVATLVFAGLIYRDYLRSPKVRSTVGREILNERYSVEGIAEERYRSAIRQGVDVFVELLAKLDTIKRARGLEEDVANTAAEMGHLLSLQRESARQVEELHRILRLVGAEQKLEASGTLGLHRENAAAIQREIAEADELVDIIAQQMETLLLQVFRYEAGATELLARAEGRQRSVETLDRIQEKVDARRHAARQLIELVVPDFAAETSLTVEEPARGETSVQTNGSRGKASVLDDLRDLTYLNVGNGTSAGEADADECTRLVGEALRNLHNPAALASCELVQKLPRTLAACRLRLGYDELVQPSPLEQAKALAHVLAAAIEGLKPPEGSDPQAHRESLQYSILTEEYLQARSTTAVMVRHGIGESTLHRHRKRAVELIAHELEAQEERLARATTNGHA